VKQPSVDWLGFALVAYGAFVGITGNTISLPWIIGGKPAFQVDDGKLPQVLVVEESSDRTSQLSTIFGVMRQHVEASGGQIQIIDKDNADQKDNAPWVQAAWKVKGSTVPWVVGSTKTAGVNLAVPTTSPEDAIKALSPIGVK